MIYFRIVQADDGVAPLLAVAKQKAERLIRSGLDNITKVYKIGADTIRIKITSVDAKDHVARLWLISGGTTPVFGMVPLGGFLSFGQVEKNSLKPIGTFGSPSPTKKQLLTALFDGKHVSHLRAYYKSVLTTIVSFDVDMLSDTARAVAFTDVEVGTLYYTGAGRALQIEPSTKRVWFANSIDTARNLRWVCADGIELLDTYSQQFTVATNSEGIIEDGEQTFHVSVLGGKVLMPVTVRFKDGVIEQGDVIPEGNPDYHTYKVVFTIVVLNTSFIALTDSERETNPKLKKIEVRFDQQLFGNHIALAKATKKAATNMPVDDLSGVVPPSFYSTTVSGIRYDVTVPATGTATTFTLYQILKDAIIDDAPDPFPLYAYQRSDYTVVNNGYFVPTGPGGFGIIPCGALVDTERVRQTWLIMSDDTRVNVSASDPTTSVSYPNSSLPVPPIKVNEVNVYGPNGYEELFEAFPDPPVAGVHDTNEWEESEASLGYVVLRQVPERVGFPDTKETYKIILRGEADTTLRVDVRERQSLGSLEDNLLYESAINTPPPFAGAFSPGYTVNWSYSLRGRMYANADSVFTLYDAPVSVNSHICTISQITAETSKAGGTSYAMIPPAWDNDSFRAIAQSDPQFVDNKCAAMRLSFKNYDDNIKDIVECSDLHGRLVHMMAFVDLYRTLYVISNPNADMSSSYIDSALATILDMYNTFATEASDKTFPAYIAGLRKQYVGDNPRRTGINNAEAQALWGGYFSVHMRVFANPIGLPFVTFLYAGSGSYLLVK